VVKILISAGADVNVGNNMGQTPLDLAEQRGDTEIIELLKKHGAKKDTTLLGAAVSGDIEQVKLLISKSADVNAKNRRGNTPLYLAAQNGHKDVAELLIAKGADVNAKDNNGSTLLHWACFKNNKDIAKLLIGKGAEVNVKNNANVTPLLTAATFGRITMAELLIDKGADVNAKNSLETTSLHMAARNGFKDVVELLIAKGADVNVSNNAGVTPLGMAEEKGHTEIVELLKKHGAKEDTIKIELRLLLGPSDAREVKEFLERENVEPSQISGDPNTRGYLLNAGQVEQILELERLNAEYKLLMNPTLEVLDGKTAKISSSQRVDYVSGYSEPNRPSEEPKPIRDSVEIGDRLHVKPKLQPDGQGAMEVYFDFVISNFTGYEKFMYKGKYPYEIPIIEKIAAAAHYTVASGQTLLLCGWKITSYRDDGRTEKKEQELLVLVTTQKVEPKDAQDGGEIVEIRRKNGVNE